LKVIKLIALILNNFKGIRDFTLNAAGNNIDVYGDNAAGKTTLFDAFSWVLFGRDSQGNSSPEKWIKTLNADGKVIPDLKYSVECVLDIDGKELRLKRTFYEKWVNKRGAIEPVFDGNTTDYYFNGSELKQKDYNAKIAEIIDEDLFKLLTNPSHFNDEKQFDQKQRRAKLFEIFGDSITDDDVIKLNPKLAIVKQILADKPIDLAQADVKKELSRVDKELKQSDSDIKAQQAAIFGTSSKSVGVLDKALADVRSQMSDKQAELSRIQNGGEIAVKQQRKLELQNEQLQLRNELQSASGADAGKLQDRFNKLNGRKVEVEVTVRNLQHQINDASKRIETLNTRLKDLRAQKAEVEERALDNPNVTDHCPTCKQSLPVEQVEQALKSAVEQFNLAKSRDKERIVTEGKATRKEYDDLLAQVESWKVQLAENEQGISKLQAEIDKVSAELNSLSSEQLDFNSNERYKVLQRHIDRLDVEIGELQSGESTKVDSIKQELRQLQSDIEKLEEEKASRKVAEQAKRRIEELKDNQKTLAEQYDELSAQQAALTDFARAKAELIEQRINDKFPTVRFRLFEQQVNGELKDTCDTLYGPNLVPYGAGLNRAAQINAGLEIINALSAHYQVVAPIFIDNAEAVTNVTETAGQQIKLIVLAGDKQLRVSGVQAAPIEQVATQTIDEDESF
jgi:DNA repair exonuclease SbcCD ATPase subunit